MKEHLRILPALALRNAKVEAYTIYLNKMRYFLYIILAGLILLAYSLTDYLM